MTFPILPSHQLGLVFAVASGFGFGFVLERAGFGRSHKLIGQFYGHDMTVFKVMFTAVVTAMVVVVMASAFGLADFKAIADSATSETLLVPFAIGGFVVGMGFVMSGYCPGTSWVAMASGKIDGLVTVLGTIIGGVVWSELEWLPGFAKFHNATNLGNFYLWELLRLPPKAGPAILAVAVVAMAAGSFLIVEKVEKALAPNAHPLAKATPGGRPRRLVLAGLAGAGLVGLASLSLPTGTQAGEQCAARAAASGISPAELARRVFDSPWTVRVVDVRPLADCATRRIPGSECVPEADLAKLGLAYANPRKDLVVVSGGESPVLPPAAGAYRGRILLLSGGWKAWEAFALAPPVPPAPDAPPAALEAYRLQAGIQSALTGMKAAPPPPAPAATAAGPKKKGGGCSG